MCLVYEYSDLYLFCVVIGSRDGNTVTSLGDLSVGPWAEEQVLTTTCLRKVQSPFYLLEYRTHNTPRRHSFCPSPDMSELYGGTLYGGNPRRRPVPPKEPLGV